MSKNHLSSESGFGSSTGIITALIQCECEERSAANLHPTQRERERRKRTTVTVLLRHNREENYLLFFGLDWRTFISQTRSSTNLLGKLVRKLQLLGSPLTVTQ